jgi:SAM-dependent methyltransferase
MTDLPHSSPDLQQMYRERFSGNVEYRNRVWTLLTSSFFSKWVPPDSAVLDLGCGYCEFINHIRAGKKYGMDLNPDASKHASAGVVIFQQDCSQPWPIPEGGLDVIFTSNFFEHLPDKVALENTLRHAFMSLKSGGRLIAMGPNIKYVHGAYWDFYDHYVPLTELALAEVLKKCGFLIEAAKPRFLPYTMSTGRNYPTWMLRAYLKLPIVWPVFGRQFLVIASKPKC